MNTEIGCPDFTEREFTCCDCGDTFTLSVGEQQFFWSKGLSAPKRCQTCRMQRKLTIKRNMEAERW